MISTVTSIERKIERELFEEGVACHNEHPNFAGHLMALVGFQEGREFLHKLTNDSRHVLTSNWVRLIQIHERLLKVPAMIHSFDGKCFDFACDILEFQFKVGVKICRELLDE